MVLTFVVVVWAVPSANQEFRQQSYARLQVRSGRVSAVAVVLKGYPEMTISELLDARRQAVLRFDDPHTLRLERERAGYYLHIKGALPAACLALGLLAIALAPWKRKQRFPGVAGFALSLLSVFAYYMALFSGHWAVSAMVAPAWLGAWAPPVLFSMVAVVMLGRRVGREPLATAKS